MNNIKCDKVGCDHNTGLSKECMFGVTKSLIKSAKNGEDMCPILKEKVLNYIKEDK